MATRKTFKAAVRKDALEFETSSGEVFQARPRQAAGVILKFTASMTGDGEDDNVSIGKIAEALMEFFSKSIKPEDVDRFMKMLDDPDNGIELDEATDIAAWLAGEYTARPTGKDSPQQSQTSPTGDGSTPGASPGVTTYSRTEPSQAVPSA